MYVNLTADDLPDGWAVSTNHDSHIGIIREGNPRTHIAAHPMAAQTGEDGWFAHARPGTDKIVAEAGPVSDVVEAMIESARQFNQTGEFKLKRRGSVIEKYTDSTGESRTENEQIHTESQGEKQAHEQSHASAESENEPRQPGLDYWA